MANSIWGNDKLFYEDQYRGKNSLAEALAKDLGLPKCKWGGAKDFGFDSTMLYNANTGKTICVGALTGRYTYDELFKILDKHFSVCSISKS